MQELYLDTHVALWLFADTKDKFPEIVQEVIESHNLNISPFVTLELQYLKEVGHINYDGKFIVENLKTKIDLKEEATNKMSI